MNKLRVNKYISLDFSKKPAITKDTVFMCKTIITNENVHLLSESIYTYMYVKVYLNQ